MTFKDNPAYTHQGCFNGIDVYICTDANQYHLTRYIEAQNQQIFSSAGLTKEKIMRITTEQIRICNDEGISTIRTDLGALANLIQYCSKYPLDEQCAIKMGAVLSFTEGEEPDKVDPFYENKKVALAMSDPDAYAFFLNWGIANIPEYREIYDTLTSMDYFNQRMEDQKSLLPPLLHHIV